MLLEENMHRLHSVPELRGLRLFQLVKRFVHQKCVFCLIQRYLVTTRAAGTQRRIFEKRILDVLFFIETTYHQSIFIPKNPDPSLE